MICLLDPARCLRSAGHPLTRNAIITKGSSVSRADRAAAAEPRAARQRRSRAQRWPGGSSAAPAAAVADPRLMGPEGGLRRVILARFLSGLSLFSVWLLICGRQREGAGNA